MKVQITPTLGPSRRERRQGVRAGSTAAERRAIAEAQSEARAAGPNTPFQGDASLDARALELSLRRKARHAQGKKK